MELSLHRFKSTGNETLGVLMISGEFVAFTLEDEERDIKVRGETRIPEGEYEIKFRRVVSPKTTSYRRRFPWFSYHLELQSVPNFKYVYIHVGNSDQDTDGCILVGLDAYSLAGKIGQSVLSFEKVYKRVSRALRRREKVTIKIHNNAYGI